MKIAQQSLMKVEASQGPHNAVSTFLPGPSLPPSGAWITAMLGAVILPSYNMEQVNRLMSESLNTRSFDLVTLMCYHQWYYFGGHKKMAVECIQLHQCARKSM